MKRNLAYLFGTALILVALYTSQGLHSDFIPPPPNLSAAPGDNADLNGYAWSEYIGWISMNCLTGGPDDADIDTQGEDICTSLSNYKVSIDTNPNGNPMLLSGFAWSANIGWIKFDVGSAAQDATAYGLLPAGVGGSGVAGCPVALGTTKDCRARIQKDSTGKYDFRGWARACSVFVTGCSGTLKSNSELGGWDGWISLSCHNTGTCGASSYGLDVVGPARFGPNKYSWGSGEVVGWIDWGGVTFTPPCTNVGQVCSADRLSYTYTDQFCEQTVTTCNAGNVCNQNTLTDVSCVVGVPTGTFEAAPARVRKGNEVSLSWNVTNVGVGACNITALPALPGSQTMPTVTVDPATASANNTASPVTVTIENATTFTLTCRDINGGNPSVIGTKEVNVLPSLEYI